MESKPSLTLSLEEIVLVLLRESPNLTNQEVRKRLHQNQPHLSITKYQVNTTLHILAWKGVLVYQIKDTNKYWSIPTTTENNKEEPPKTETRCEDKDYLLTLEKVKKQAALWKSRNPTNTFPTRLDKIANFIENCALKGLPLEQRNRVAQDLYLNGWD